MNSQSGIVSLLQLRYDEAAPSSHFNTVHLVEVDAMLETHLVLSIDGNFEIISVHKDRYNKRLVGDNTQVLHAQLEQIRRITPKDEIH